MNMCTSLIKVALMDNLIWFDDYSSILLVLCILSWAFNTKISIFCNIGKIFKMSKNCKPKFVFLKPNYNVFPLLIWDDSCCYSAVLFWSDQKRITVLSELRGEVSAVFILEVLKGRVKGLRWHSGVRMLLLGPC